MQEQKTISWKIKFGVCMGEMESGEWFCMLMKNDDLGINCRQPVMLLLRKEGKRLLEMTYAEI